MTSLLILRAGWFGEIRLVHPAHQRGGVRVQREHGVVLHYFAGFPARTIEGITLEWCSEVSLNNLCAA